MRSTAKFLALAVVVPVSFVACKKKERPYELRGAAPGELGETSAIVNGTEIKTRGSGGAFLLPAGLNASAIKTVAFRYQTPCGAHDVPNKLHPQEKHMDIGRYVEADPASDDGYLWKHEVIVDKNGQDKVEVVIGKQAVVGDTAYGSSSDGWDKVRVAAVFGTECAAEHEVTVNGTPVGKLPGRVPEGLAWAKDDRYSLPIFVTSKAACYRLVRLATETVDRKTGANMGWDKDTEATSFRGPGAFWLPESPDVVMKEPDDPKKATGLYEVPCEPAPAPAATDTPAAGSGAPPAN